MAPYVRLRQICLVAPHLEPVISDIAGILGLSICYRDGNVANRPIYIALAVTVEGTRDILGLWAGEHGDGEGAKFWVRVCRKSKTVARKTSAWSCATD